MKLTALPRCLAGLAGLAALGAGFSLRHNLDAGGGGFYPGLARFDLLFWLCYFGLILPGLLLLAGSLEPAWPGGRGRQFEARAFAVVLVLALLGWAGGTRLLRWYWLDDAPATASEGGLEFGGRLWANAALAGPAFDPAFGFTMTGLERRELSLYPVEGPAALLVAALASRSGLGQLLFALLAAASGLALIFACRHLDGRAGQAAAMLLWCFSPMLLLQGVTASGELVAGSFLALAWAAWLQLAHPAELGRRRELQLAALLGGAAALALLTRPAEAACLLLPVGLHLGWLAWDERQRRWPWALAAALAATSLPLSWFYHRAIGAELWPAAAAPAPGLATRLTDGCLPLALVSLLYFAGPPLLLLLAFALRRGGEVALVAGAAWLLLLLEPLWQDEPAAAPLPLAGFFSALPLLALAVLGLAELRRRLLAAGFSARPVVALGLAWLGGLLLFSLAQGEGLSGRSALLRALEQRAAELEPAIVLVEPVSSLWRLRPELAVQDYWRGELPHPDPWLRDRVIFANAATAEPAKLRRAFPRRRLYLARAVAGAELYALEALP